MAEPPEGRKQQILQSALSLLTSEGLTNWSIEGCSKRAHCAKGLVLHYFGTKDTLLQEVARSLVATRWSRWSSALSNGGIGSLDTLWDHLVEESTAGTARGLLELRLANVPGAALGSPEAAELRRRLGTALDLSATELPSAGVLEHLLEGYLLALMRGVPSEEVREAFFRYWLSYVR